MDFKILREREEQSASGDFHVHSDCCITCGVPQMVAPDLVGWIDDGRSRCYWKKQPETSAELEQAFAVFDGQEVGCHRYAGHDAAIQARIGRENCDFPIETFTEISAHVEPPKFQIEPSFFEWIRARFHRQK